MPGCRQGFSQIRSVDVRFGLACTCVASCNAEADLLTCFLMKDDVFAGIVFSQGLDPRPGRLDVYRCLNPMKAAVRLLLQNCDLQWNFFEV